MKTKKTLAIIATAVMAVGLCACGGDKEETTAAAVTTEVVTTEAAGGDDVTEAAPAGEETTAEASADTPTASGSLREKTKLTVGGYTFAVGDKFADVKGNLPAEVRPSESIKPCDPNAQGEITHYYYPGCSVEVNLEDTIISVHLTRENGEGDAAFACGLTLGSSKEDVLKTIDIQLDDTEYGATYMDGQYIADFIWDDDGNVMAASATDQDLPY